MRNVHAGHRERLKDKFIEYGRDGLEEHEILELLLFYAIPQKNTNELAHRLLDKFGSLSGVLDASMEELMEVPGVGKHCAVLMKVVVEVGRSYFLNEKKKERFTTVAEAAEYIIKVLYAKKNELFYLFCLDSGLHLLGYKCISEGSVEQVPVDMRKVVSTVLNLNAVYVILAHNHPNGTARPSRADIELTQQIANTLAPLNIAVCDHIITAGNDFYSFSRQGSFSVLTDNEILKAAQY